MFGHDATKLGGFILVDGKVVAETKVCCHCSKHWVPEPGSGKVRGFCVKCHGYLCGAEKCMVHYAFEKQIEDYEALLNKGKLPNGPHFPLL